MDDNLTSFMIFAINIWAWQVCDKLQRRTDQAVKTCETINFEMLTFLCRILSANIFHESVFAALKLLLLVLNWIELFCGDRVVFKWPSKVITWLRLLRLVIGLKESHQFFSQWEAKPKPIAPCTRDFSRASSEFQITARICDWFIVLFVPVVIGRSNCFGFGFSTVIWKPLNPL